MAGEKEIPYCTIFLVLGAVIANVLVLVGNLDAAASFKSIGQSTGGWSNVGTSMAKSFDNELDTLMNDMTLSLTHAVADINEVQSELDNMLASVGKKADKSLLQLAKDASAVVVKHGPNSTDPMEATQRAAMAEVSVVIREEVGKANKLLEAFMKSITPALLQMGKWEISFGSKLQEDISQFGTTIDWVQKAFDTMMAKLKGADPTWEEYMVYNTFNLFDPEANGCITEKGLLGAATMYGITALSGIKGEAVFAKYAGKDGCIDQDEYIEMVSDPGLNGILTTVLRTYAEALSKVAGTVGQARLRSAVASSVVTYLNLVSVKNHTKVGWIAERLTNSSVPMAFTACVMRELGVQSANPNSLSTINVGQLFTEFLLYQNMNYTLEAFKMMSQPSFWTTEGFLPDDLPAVVDVVGLWIQVGLNVTRAGKNPARLASSDEASGDGSDAPSLLEVSAEGKAMTKAEALFQSGYVERLKTSAAAEIRKQKHQSHLALIERRETLDEAHSSRHLFRELLGGKTMSKGSLTPTEWQCLHSGVPAVPATLEFAKFLAWNSSRDSGQFLHACFQYSSTSSNQLDSFANEIQSFVKKTQSFLATVSSYSGQNGIDTLESEIASFAKGAESAIISAIEPRIAAIVQSVVGKALKQGVHDVDPEAILKEVEKEFDEILAGGNHLTKLAMADTARAVGMNSSRPNKVTEDGGNGMMVFEEVNILMKDLMALLPSAVTTVNEARSEVMQVAQMMTSIFHTFSIAGPSLFDEISMAYGLLWTVYFVLLLPLTLGTLGYGMWASGWMGGPSAADWPEEAEELPAKPKSFFDRLSTCCNACSICCGQCNDTMMCFWSCMIIYQIIVLVIFIVAVVLSLLNGVKLFMTSSCQQIYMLNQEDMCTNVLNSVKGFVTTFTVDPLIAIEDTCNAKSLLMCDLIGKKMQTSVLYTTVFSFVAAIFQFQLVIESAILHERARMRRIVLQLQKET